MRLAISNIAWDVSEDKLIAELLQLYRIDAIDIAPGKYFQHPSNTTANEIYRVKEWWAERGIEIAGMQALLFGTSGLNVFGTPECQSAMLEHFDALCRIGAGLGASRLVFGSPKNRDRNGLNDIEATAIAISFFRRLGDIASNHGVVICLEPNPVCYGANFMVTSVETAQVVEAVNHQSIRMQFDSGALTINGEEPTTILQGCAHLIGHIHASEPNLLPLGDGKTDHGKMYRALMPSLPRHLVSIEMVATSDETHFVSIERAIGVAIRHYRPHDCVSIT
jgi:D-psicose/D-tagatose/L-ribulose 3-epimerase